MLRLRAFNGFISMPQLTEEWIQNNPSFSVYKDDLQIGRLSIENNTLYKEVFEESEVEWLDALIKDLIVMFPTLVL